MATVKAWKLDDAKHPFFPEEYEIIKKAVLQVTDLKTNHNKYYALELHRAKDKTNQLFRVFTHYGRTDDLESNPEAGAKECRYAGTEGEALAIYESIYRQKTAARKGYKEVALASSKIGSQKARGTSSGDVDERTLEKMATGKTKPTLKPSTLAPGLQRLVRYIYDEATSALTSTLSATITANGIETPLGILTIGQIEKGEDILAQMYKVFTSKKGKKVQEELERLSGEFYTAIPHRLGRRREAVATSVINSLEAFDQKQSTLQLMKDMLQVNGEEGNVLFNARIDQEYDALQCHLDWVNPEGEEFAKMARFVEGSQVKTKNIRVKNIFKVRREGEWQEFTAAIANQRLLFHGSRIQNWVGLLSRGILLPKIVVSLGVNRTDEGWLGHGLYFGDAACTSAFYCTPGRHKTALLAVTRVALGNMKDYCKITYGLTQPPDGYHSCHGVRSTREKPSEFADDEYVIYNTRQQRIEYLIEFEGGGF